MKKELANKEEWGRFSNVYHLVLINRLGARDSIPPLGTGDPQFRSVLLRYWPCGWWGKSHPQMAISGHFQSNRKILEIPALISPSGVLLF